MLLDNGEKKPAIDAVRTMNFFSHGPKVEYTSPVVLVFSITGSTLHSVLGVVSCWIWSCSTVAMMGWLNIEKGKP